MTKDHTFEELSLDEMEMVGGGWLPAVMHLLAIIAKMHDDAKLIEEASKNDDALQDKWDGTFAMG